MRVIRHRYVWQPIIVFLLILSMMTFAACSSSSTGGRLEENAEKERHDEGNHDETEH